MLFLLLLISSFTSSGQVGHTKIDSLLHIIEKPDHRFDVNTYKELSGHLEQLDLKEAEKKLAHFEKDVYGRQKTRQIYLKLLKADIHKITKKAENRLSGLEDALKLAQKNGFREAEAAIREQMGLLLMHQKQNVEALENMMMATLLYDSLKQYKINIPLYHEMAKMQVNSRNYISTIEILVSYFETYDKIPKDEIEYVQKWHTMSAYNTLGLARSRLEQYDEALDAYRKATEVAESIDNRFWIALIAGNIGFMYELQEDYETALAYVLNDLKVSIEENQYENANTCVLAIAYYYTELDDIDSALYYLQMSEQFLKEKKIQDQSINYYQYYAKVYEAQGKYELAFNNLKRFYEDRSEILKNRKERELVETQNKYEFERKRAQITLLSKENQIQEQSINNQRSVILGTSLIAILAFALLFTTYRRIKSKQRANDILVQRNKAIQQQKQEIETQQNLIKTQNEELKSQSETLEKQNLVIQETNNNLEKKVEQRTHDLLSVNQELETFLYRASHDMKGPLASILGLQNLARKITDKNELIAIANKVDQTAIEMDGMLNKLQMNYYLHKSKPVKGVITGQEMKSCIARLERIAKSKNINMSVSNMNGLTYHSDEKLMQIILLNLVENALHFYDAESKSSYVNITIQDEEEHLKIVVEDNGIGIEDAYQDKVFNLYFKASQNSRGNGLGLFLVKKAVEKLKGKIMLVSTPHRGSAFKVLLPHSKKIPVTSV